MPGYEYSVFQATQDGTRTDFEKLDTEGGLPLGPEPSFYKPSDPLPWLVMFDGTSYITIIA